MNSSSSDGPGGVVDLVEVAVAVGAVTEVVAEVTTMMVKRKKKSLNVSLSHFRKEKLTK